MSFLTPNEHERILASMFYSTKDRQYAAKFSMGKVWVRGDEGAGKELDELREEIEEEFGEPLIRLQHMANMSSDLGSMFELSDGRVCTVYELRERLDQFVFDIHDIVNKSKSPFGDD